MDKKKKDNGSNNDLQNITQNAKDGATLYTGDELGCSGRSSNTIYWG